METATRCKCKIKAEEQLKADMEAFEAKGGKVQHIEPGVISLTPEKFGRIKKESDTNWKKD